MKSYIDPDFRKAYGKLPKEVREQARKAYRLFKQDPYHTSLHFKPIRPSQPLYSVRVGLNYRVLGIRDGDEIVWFWIGSHADMINYYHSFRIFCTTFPIIKGAPQSPAARARSFCRADHAAPPANFFPYLQ